MGKAKSRAFPKSQHTFPHMRNGASMYPDKPAAARTCMFCGRTTTDYLVDAKRGLCTDHRSPRDLKRVAKVKAAEERARRAKRGRPDRRPWGRVIHPSVR